MAERVHYDNPFAETKKWYVNQWWSKNAKASGGEAIAGVSTGVWMDRIAAIESYNGQAPNENFGLREHLDAVLEQGADLFMFVVYDLPGRDCAAEASNGELPATAEGMAEYKKEYIGKIANILGEEKYAGITVVAIIEIDSLPNLVTNSNKVECQQVANSSPFGYTEGIRFALTQLKKLPNVHSYIDAAHSGWLGWDEKFDESTRFIADVVAGSSQVGPTPAPGWDSINGFITNTSNYTPLEEPYLGDPEAIAGDVPLRSATFYDWNPVFGELQFTKKWREAMISHGAGSDIGMLIDTGRNGWGGDDRPSGPSSASDPNSMVNESRIDRRPHRGSWCNQRGGIGERPQANPPGQSHIDAYVWVKPPGESDGVSTPDFEVDPNDKNKKYDPMCGPNDVNHYAEDAASTRGQGIGTGAMEDAPHAGRWYEEGFKVLIENAYPPL
ncbi:MAG: glycoside hydrolase family 6 protein [Deltaproteobacteria bacterium]|nr:glycoside hydrolase family 6 protein [Deltaproteobacteria bacterium]